MVDFKGIASGMIYFHHIGAFDVFIKLRKLEGFY